MRWHLTSLARLSAHRAGGADWDPTWSMAVIEGPTARGRGSAPRSTSRRPSHPGAAAAGCAPDPAGAATPAGARGRLVSDVGGVRPADGRPRRAGATPSRPTGMASSSCSAGSSSRISRARSRPTSASSGAATGWWCARRASGARPRAHPPAAARGAATGQRGQTGGDLVSRVRRGVPDARCATLDVLHRSGADALRPAGPGPRHRRVGRRAMTRRGPGEGSIYLRQDGRWGARSTSATRTAPRPEVRPGHSRPRSRTSSRSSAAPAEHRPIPYLRIRLGPFLRQWLEEVARPRLRATTYKSYRQSSRATWSRASATSRLAKLTPPEIQTFLNRKQAAGLSASPRPVHPRGPPQRAGDGGALGDDEPQRGQAGRHATGRAARE